MAAARSDAGGCGNSEAWPDDDIFGATERGSRENLLWSLCSAGAARHSPSIPAEDAAPASAGTLGRSEGKLIELARFSRTVFNSSWRRGCLKKLELRNL
jgi:hypothetical protein